MLDFLNNYRKIANETSGLVTLGALQTLIIAVVVKRSDLADIAVIAPGFWLTIFALGGGLFITLLSVISSIFQEKTISGNQKGVVVIIFMGVFFALLFSAVISVKSL